MRCTWGISLVGPNDGVTLLGYILQYGLFWEEQRLKLLHGNLSPGVSRRVMNVDINYADQ